MIEWTYSVVFRHSEASRPKVNVFTILWFIMQAALQEGCSDLHSHRVGIRSPPLFLNPWHLTAAYQVPTWTFTKSNFLFLPSCVFIGTHLCEEDRNISCKHYFWCRNQTQGLHMLSATLPELSRSLETFLLSACRCRAVSGVDGSVSWRCPWWVASSVLLPASVSCFWIIILKFRGYCDFPRSSHFLYQVFFFF